MASARDRPVRFHVVHDGTTAETLVAGFAEHGLAGLTAANFLVEQLDLDPVGHVTVDGYPSITPFENGTPRWPMRLFGGPDSGVTVLTGEQFVPVSAASSLGADLHAWVGESAIQEVAVASGVPIAHGPDDHRTFFVATDDFRERRLAGTDVPPMGKGFLDGVNAALVQQGLSASDAVGVLLTPVHQQNPDVEAAIRLVETLSTVYDLSVDTAPLEGFAEEIRRYYGNLAERMQDVAPQDQPEDRMYM